MPTRKYPERPLLRFFGKRAGRLVREQALENAPLSPDARARIAPLMHPQDWEGLAVDESALHYRPSSQERRTQW
jgi:hypothetical protein